MCLEETTCGSILVGDHQVIAFWVVPFGRVDCSTLLEDGNPNARHHGKGVERATFCHGVELSYCLVTVRALTETYINTRLHIKFEAKSAE